MKKLTLFFALFSLFLSNSILAQRLVVLTPDTADVVAALGAAPQVVGIHNHNHNPVYKDKPNIGFLRALSPEPIIAQKPDLIVGSYMALPANIYTRLNQVGLKSINVNPKETLQDYISSIRLLGQLLNKNPQAEQLISHFQAGMKPYPATGKRYLLSYDGRHVAGRNTVGDTLIKLAGGINAAAAIDGLKPLSREAWLAAKPDIIIVAKHNEQMIGGLSGLTNRPELRNSNAVKNGQILFWHADDFLRYGLTSPQSIKRLNELAK